ncbi:MAG: NifU family protein [Elusimicrobiaceae bacterium]|nr:NifU family protein [Elusimicrobiaceae bacterium]
MTLEEASRVTNNDIVKLLGDLPEEKMHCSVMGMEALQAAIADYRGEKNPLENDDDHEGRIVCKCFGVTDVKIRNVARANNLHKAEDITHYCKAGGACGACLGDIQQILDELWSKPEAAEAADGGFAKLSFVQKVMKIQEVIDREIKPLLEQDGGSIELVDVKDNLVSVRLQGRCSSCPASGATLKHVVQDKLHEFVSPDLQVESI